MPQVHIVAYCGDLGYGAARGAEMLAVMLASASSAGSPRAGSATGSAACARCCSARCCRHRAGAVPALRRARLAVRRLALFGLFQGGLVPSYAIIVREYFKPSEAGGRLGRVLLATLLGMAAGGWASGAIFDLTGSYRAASSTASPGTSQPDDRLLAAPARSASERNAPFLDGVTATAPMSSGRSRRQRSSACGQRGWKLQPGGGAADGTSPATGVRGSPVRSICGTASSSMRV